MEKIIPAEWYFCAMKPHQKHAKLARPSLGNFGRLEWAILGTPCGQIKQLAYALTERLKDRYRVAYVDADHKSADEEAETGRDKHSALGNGAWLEFTDKITFSRFDFDRSFNDFDNKQFFAGADVVLVNGNHFPAARQIAVINPKKPLEKKLAKLTKVSLILLTEGVEAVPGFLWEHLGDQRPPVLRWEDLDGIVDFLSTESQKLLPPVKGLVLAGGKSTRMGQDKGLMDYHGMPQRDYVFQLLEQAGCAEVKMSCRPDQVEEIGSEIALADRFAGLGPFGGILSAFQDDPNAAWLVMACDLPFLTGKSLQILLDQRNVSVNATAFLSPFTNFPDPLITLWEPRAYGRMLHFLSLGYSCPRKVLINSEIELLDHPVPEELSNVNNREEYEAALQKLKNALP
jgi:molybdopterin-guanine dinucleotide biosynthesis protein A